MKQFTGQKQIYTWERNSYSPKLLLRTFIYTVGTLRHSVLRRSGIFRGIQNCTYVLHFFAECLENSVDDGSPDRHGIPILLLTQNFPIPGVIIPSQTFTPRTCKLKSHYAFRQTKERKKQGSLVADNHTPPTLCDKTPVSSRHYLHLGVIISNGATTSVREWCACHKMLHVPQNGNTELG